MKKLFLLLLPIILVWLSNSVKASCFSEFGFYSVDNFNGTCSCMRWYQWGTDFLWNRTCVKAPTCSDQYWWAAMDNYDGTCSCMHWYIFDTDFLWNKACVSGNQVCTRKYGIYSNYDSLAHSCGCDAWYTRGENSQCVKKQNNVYFLLKELDEDNSEAIIYSSYSKKYYYISYWYWCSKISKYDSKLIVVNLGYDFEVDRYDKIVLQDDDQTCDIKSKEVVDEEYTLKSCKDIFGSHSTDIGNNQCKCEYGYTFDKNSSSCIANGSTYTPSYDELSSAILWMYNNKMTAYNNPSDFMSNSFLTREQAAKFFTLYSMIVLNKSTSDTSDVSFKDLYSADPTLQSSILYAYKFWLFKWTNWYFLPTQNLTQAQAIAVLMRAVYGNMVETGSKWYENYYLQASKTWILSWLWFDYKTLDSTNITRWEVALLLYRLNSVE